MTLKMSSATGKSPKVNQIKTRILFVHVMALLRVKAEHHGESKEIRHHALFNLQKLYTTRNNEDKIVSEKVLEELAKDIVRNLQQLEHFPYLLLTDLDELLDLTFISMDIGKLTNNSQPHQSSLGSCFGQQA
ncbi:hypothetical protein BT96DRAFT_942311 [Gymnopus androsaceus JB14]|uniref:Uncharacterized protein n=1 Tax=Gymnopus androsaceus JB14 TaxID=1447944 RepID=A0A6A4HCV4_9AGAR|nr:hypothetical protein BT96DRAFT_942311 [Gymnopus androsaceus JB14]